MGGHTFPLFHQMGSFLSVFPDVLSTLGPCLQLGNPAQPQGSKNKLFSIHIAPAYFEGHVEPRFGGGENAVSFVTLWSILAFICLSLRKHQWCSGLSLVPGKLRGASIASDIVSPDSLSHLIQALPEVGILNDAQRIIFTRFFLFGA